MSEVVKFPGITRLDMPADLILQEATGKLSGVIVIGWTKDEIEYFASSIADGGDVLWLLERFKKSLLETADE